MKIGKFLGVMAGIAVIGVLAGVFIWRATRTGQIAEASTAPLVETACPGTKDIVNTTNIIGTVEPSDMVYVSAKTSGDVTEVNVHAGDSVKKGQLLCTIDTKQVSSAKSSLDSARVNLDKANADLSRQEALYESGDISQETWEQYKNSQESAQIQYDQAKYNYETQMEYSRVTAAIDGTVESCSVEEHDSVAAGTQLMVISAQGQKAASFYVTERIRGYLTPGDTVSVSRDGTASSGTVSEISTMADEQNGLYKVKANLDSGADLPTGSKVEITVTSAYAKNAMTVPLDSVYYDDGKPYVYVVNETDASGSSEAASNETNTPGSAAETSNGNPTVRQVYIETGLMDDEDIEVTGGLSASDNVVTTWSSELGDGAEVRIKGADTAGGSAEEETSGGAENLTSDGDESGDESTAETAGEEVQG